MIFLQYYEETFDNERKIHVFERDQLTGKLTERTNFKSWRDVYYSMSNNVLLQLKSGNNKLNFGFRINYMETKGK